MICIFWGSGKICAHALNCGLFGLSYISRVKLEGRSSYLDKDSEEDDGDNGGKKHVSQGEMFLLQQKAEGESDGTSQATVGYYKLIFGGQFDDAELVNDGRQSDNTCEKHVREGLFMNRGQKGDWISVLCLHEAFIIIY